MNEIDSIASSPRPVEDLCERLRLALSQGYTGALSQAQESSDLPADCLRMLEDLAAIQRFAKGLSDGDLSSELYVRGRLAGSLKALQANLRHLTWQVQQVAAGDLTQKVAFMGDFSAAFNLMIDRLEASQRLEREMRAVSDAMRDAAGDLNRALSQEEVLDSIITFAPGLANSEALDVLLFAGEQLRIRRAAGRQRDTQEELAEIESVELDVQAFPAIAKAGETRQPEAAASEEQEVFPGYPAAGWARAAMVLALVVEGQTVGFVCAFSADPNRFFQQDMQRMAVYTSQAAIAMSKARLVDALAWYASTDPLTGIPNRRNFFQRAEREQDRARRNGRTFAILMLDIDHFKSINDRYGHAAGDWALTETAAVCVENLRVSDTIARLGGEEFSVLLPETDEPAAWVTAERLRNAIASRVFRFGEETLQITVSIGVAVWGGGDESFQVTLSHADKAMYYAKQNGRNRAMLFSSGLIQ